MALNLFSRYPREVERRAAAFESEMALLEIAVAGRFSRGNIALQSECVLTPDALELEREELRRKVIRRRR